MPGPGDYDVDRSSTKKSYIIQTIPSENLSQERKEAIKTKSPVPPPSSNVKDARSSAKHIYFPEYKKEFQNVEGPGPGLY